MSREVLIVCSVGDEAGEVLRWASAEGPIYDLAIASYGNGECPVKPYAKFFISQQGYKCANYAGLYLAYPELVNYDYTLFIDDDIVIEEKDIKLLVETARLKRLDLCQPALGRDSDISWPHLKQKSWPQVELTRFIEVQCFLVSKQLMRRVLPLFFMAKTGLYLDVAISYTAHKERMRAAVVHSVVMRHPFRANKQSVRRQQNYNQQHKELGPLVDFYCNSHYLPTLQTMWFTSRAFELCNGALMTLVSCVYFGARVPSMLCAGVRRAVLKTK